jgi:hypothetical protein
MPSSWVIGLAHDYSLETRIRRLIESHQLAGASPSALVMNTLTWRHLVTEMNGRGYAGGYFWTSAIEGAKLKPTDNFAFLGIPILIKEFIPDDEVIIGVK